MMDNDSSVQEVIADITQSEESFTFSCLSDECVAYNTNYDYTDEFEPNNDLYEHELYFDMDITLPFTWGDSVNTPNTYPYIGSPRDIMGNSDRLQDIQEFEFGITFSDNGPSSNGFIGALSPADDLFYKGQLLPLHLPPRLRMVERLSSLESNSIELEEDDYGNFNANGTSSGFTPSILELIDKDRYHPFSCQGSLVEGVCRLKKPNSTMVMSSGAWAEMTKEHDAGVFPDCYKDPTLQMLQGDVNCANAEVYARPSIGWRVFLPGSRGLSCQNLASLQESFPGFDVRKAKEANYKWGGFSILKLRASASFFKSLFHAGELGRLLVYQKGHHRHSRGAKDEIREENGEEEGGHFSSFANSSAYVAYGIEKQPLKSASAQAERDKIIRKAREYMQKYVRLFKSMYVSISHTNREQTRNLLESSSSVEDMSTACRFSSCKSKKGIVNAQPKPLPTTSFSKGPKRNGDSIVDCLHHSCRLYDAEDAGCHSIIHGSARLEIENRIQGAIAHCKKSSSLSS